MLENLKNDAIQPLELCPNTLNFRLSNPEFTHNDITNMTKICCSRKISFDAAHRVMMHEGKCKHIHGHRYTVEATFEAVELDGLGRVVDFGLIKEILGEWIERHWDHTLILWEKDRSLGQGIAGQTGQTVYYMPNNPTAENMALYLIAHICPVLFAAHGVRCTELTIHETPNCSATASL